MTAYLKVAPPVPDALPELFPLLSSLCLRGTHTRSRREFEIARSFKRHSGRVLSRTDKIKLKYRHTDCVHDT